MALNQALSIPQSISGEYMFVKLPAASSVPFGTFVATTDQGTQWSNGSTWQNTPPTLVTAGSAGSAGVATQGAATYAAARLLVGSVTGDTLYVFGRTAAGDGGQGLFTWVAGGTTTVDEGYVLQATGGTWNRVDPSPTTGETLLNASWYNIKPANSDVTNDAGFAKLKAQMQTSGTTTWRVYFPPGAYTYTNNRWLFGVQRVIIDAYDCTFQCTWSADSSQANCVPFNVNDFLQDWGDVAWPGNTTYANGYLFNTATSGAISITTTTAADAGNFTPGMRVILHGYDQQGSGYPPSLRYFEYKTVLTAVAGTGVVTFTNPIKYFYDSRWWDTANYAGTGKTFGAPRILSIERANKKQAKLIWIKGVKLLTNPTTPGGTGSLQLGADLVIYEDVSGISFNVVMTDQTIIRRSTFISALSSDINTGDKLITRLTIEDSLLDGTVPAIEAINGCPSGRIELTRCTLLGDVGQVAPRSLYINDCDIVPGSSTFGGISTASATPLGTVCVQNTRVHNTGGLNYGFTNQASPGLSLTVGTVVGTDIRISFDSTGKAVAYSIDYGMTLTNTVTGNTGIITAIFWESGSPGTLRIAGTWSTPSPGDVFHYYDVLEKSDGGGNIIVGAQVPFWRNPPALFYQDSPTFTGNISVPGAIVFPATSSTNITNASYGAQFNSGGNSLFYFGGGSWNAQANLTFFTGVGVKYSEGTNGRMGLATLVAGTVTVSTNVVTANSRIFLSRATTGGTPGHLSYTISAGTSFTITSSSGTESSTVAWWVVN